MDPHTESDRWLAISLKLLSTRDFLGSRTFAIRARESDPNNPSSIPDQILAIVDTILSSQNRVDPTQQPDWYSILQLPRLVRDPHLISDHYRRLSFLLNPDLNKFPFADFALQLIVNAWSVLSDPNQKCLFDHHLSLSSLSREPDININNNIIGFGVPTTTTTTTAASINTFQFFQPPSNPDGGPLPPQWQMRDPTPAKGGKSTPPPVDPTPPPQPQPQPQPPPVGDTLINNANNFENNSNNAHDNVVEGFWTSCPYCFYIYEYDKVYEDCTLRCGNCRRGFHAFKIPNPPLVGGEKGNQGLFCCWSFYPLAFSMAAWKKHSEFRPNGVPNWVPFSPMFANPVGNGGGVGDFHMFVSNASACVGPRVVRSGKSEVRSPRVYVDDDDDDEVVQISDPSDADTSDGDWRTRLSYKKKRRGKRGKRRGFKRGRPQKMEKQSQGNEKDRVFGGGVSVGGEDMEDECDSQAVVVGLVAGRKSFANKNMASAMMMRKHTRRSIKDMGNLDLNVEFNNEGDEHAPTVSAVNGEEDVIENSGFFEGLDEFLSTLPMLNVGGDEKANKPS